MRICGPIYWIGSGLVGLSHEYDANVFAVDCGDQCALIDCGAGVDAERLLMNARADGLGRVGAVLLTHSHWDHARGASAVSGLTDAQLIGHPLLEEQLTGSLWRERLQPRGVRPVKLTTKITGPMELKFGDTAILGIPTPGHTADGVSYLVSSSRTGGALIATGDTVLGEGGVGRVGEGGSAADWLRSLDVIERLDADGLLPGHRSFALRHAGVMIEIARQRLQQQQSASERSGPDPLFPGWWLGRSSY